MSGKSALAGAAGGFLVGGPLGALVGAVAGALLDAAPSVADTGASGTSAGSSSTGDGTGAVNVHLNDAGELERRRQAAREIVRLKRLSKSETQALFDAAFARAANAGVSAAMGPLLNIAGAEGAAVALPCILVYFGPAFLASIMPGSPLTPEDVMNLAPPATVAKILSHVGEALDALIFDPSARDTSAASLKLTAKRYGIDPSWVDAAYNGTATPAQLAALAGMAQRARFDASSTGKDLGPKGDTTHVGPGGAPSPDAGGGEPTTGEDVSDHSNDLDPKKHPFHGIYVGGIPL